MSNGAVSRDPEVIVQALDAAGLALCHSDYSDAAEYDIYGLLGAYSTRRYFPHHSAVPIRTDGTAALSCVSASQPNTGAVELDVYPSPSEASAALRRVGQVWLAAWLYGNVALVLDQTTTRPVEQQVSQVLDHLPGAFRVR
jgi:hypothetical protein